MVSYSGIGKFSVNVNMETKRSVPLFEIQFGSGNVTDDRLEMYMHIHPLVGKLLIKTKDPDDDQKYTKL